METPQVKRPRGRPRKNPAPPVSISATGKTDLGTSPATAGAGAGLEEGTAGFSVVTHTQGVTVTTDLHTVGLVGSTPAPASKVKGLFVIVYRLRLGDLVRCLPIARHFSALGYDVAFDCLPQYHGIFDAVSYARPLRDDENYTPSRALDLQIWPARFEEFRQSGKTWMDFVYSTYPALGDVDRKIVFDRIDATPDPRRHYGLPENYSLLCPFGYSSTTTHDFNWLLVAADKRLDPHTTFMLVDGGQSAALRNSGWKGMPLLTADSPGHLPRLLRDAAEVMCINSAPSVIASAVRQNYFHVADKNEQDNWCTPNQILVTL